MPRTNGSASRESASSIGSPMMAVVDRDAVCRRNELEVLAGAKHPVHLGEGIGVGRSALGDGLGQFA